MAKINIFERLKYECKLHPTEVDICKISFPKVPINIGMIVNVKSLVEREGCNWNWYCEYYNHDPNDIFNTPKNINGR